MGWRLLAAGLALSAAQKPALLCANVTQDRFDPDCLPPHVRDYSDLGRVGKDPPYIYLQWMLAETCGIRLAEFKTQFATLPQVVARGMKSIFINFLVYVVGNFVAVGAMSIFYVAPSGRRCWGLFRVGSMDYKRVVGPLYYVLFFLALWIAAGLTYRFFGELHAFRSMVHAETQLEGKWPVEGGGFAHVPLPSAACSYVFELRWVTYRHCFDILVLMTFTSVDLFVCILEIFWTSLIACFAYCRCLCCFCCKGCCGICGWLICNCTSAICCLVPIALVFVYLVSGLLGATIICILLLALASAALLGLSWGLRYALAGLTGCFCKPLPTSWVDQAMLLHPFPPGSPYFTTAMVVREPMNDAERASDLKLQEATPFASSFDVEQAHLNSDYTIWENHLGMPWHFLNYSFPAWYTMTFIPALLMTIVSLAFLRSNEILFAKSMAEVDLSWLPVGPPSSWPYHWVVLEAVFAGITEGFRGIFVDVPVAIVSAPLKTVEKVWGIADKGIDVMNLFRSDHRDDPTQKVLTNGQFEGNFDAFESTVLILRLILTVLFGCLRLTAIIARTPDIDSSQSDEEGEYEEDEDSDEAGGALCPGL